MNLIKWNELDNTPSLYSMFDDVFSNDYFTSLKKRISSPAMNIHEEQDKYCVDLAIPGVDKKDCTVQIDDGVLTVSATTKQEKKHDDTKYSRYEYNVSSFSKSLQLPQNVDVENISAQYENGELKITLPKVQETLQDHSKHVTIQ